jgi:hypothetical protein
MRIQHGQRLFGIPPCEILLSILQIRIGKVIVRVARVRIREAVELENLNRCVSERHGFSSTNRVRKSQHPCRRSRSYRVVA